MITVTTVYVVLVLYSTVVSKRIGQYEIQSQAQDIHIQERWQGSKPYTTSSRVITRSVWWWLKCHHEFHIKQGLEA